MEFKIQVNNFNIYKAVLTIISFKINLSAMEIDMIATMFKYKFMVVTNDCRDIFRKALDKDQYNINNYIRRLIKKGVLVKEDKEIKLNANLINIVNNTVTDKELTFKFDGAN